MFKDFYPVLKILLRFVGIYLILVLLYQWYLGSCNDPILDPISRWVGQQASWIQNQINYTTLLIDGDKGVGIFFYVKNEYVSRMVEGCNAVSVMIMFVAFVSAFYKGFKTFAFILGGLIMLHIMNVLRIVGLNIVLRDYKEYGKMCHDYVFPAVIYGTVVVLWIIWIKFFALKKPDESA